jgi:hypothetical protein
LPLHLSTIHHTLQTTSNYHHCSPPNLCRSFQSSRVTARQRLYHQYLRQRNRGAYPYRHGQLQTPLTCKLPTRKRSAKSTSPTPSFNTTRPSWRTMIACPPGIPSKPHVSLKGTSFCIRRVLFIQ